VRGYEKDISGVHHKYVFSIVFRRVRNENRTGILEFIVGILFTYQGDANFISILSFVFGHIVQY